MRLWCKTHSLSNVGLCAGMKLAKGIAVVKKKSSNYLLIQGKKNFVISHFSCPGSSSCDLFDLPVEVLNEFKGSEARLTPSARWSGPAALVALAGSSTHPVLPSETVDSSMILPTRKHTTCALREAATHPARRLPCEDHCDDKAGRCCAVPRS